MFALDLGIDISRILRLLLFAQRITLTVLYIDIVAHPIVKIIGMSSMNCQGEDESKDAEAITTEVVPDTSVSEPSESKAFPK